MLDLIKEDNTLLILLLLLGLLSLLWPLLTKPLSLLHLIGVLINNAAFLSTFLLIKNSYLHNNNLEMSCNFAALLLSFKVSNLGLILGMLISTLWPIAYIYSWGYLKTTHDQNSGKFLFFINLSIVMSIAVSLSGDLITMFCSYEILTLCTIPLIAHNNNNVYASYALKKYVIYLLGASILFWLPAILIIKNITGELKFISEGYNFHHVKAEYMIVLITLCLFGIAKSTFFPVSGWLPEAMIANYPVSALLHAVAVVKVGIYCIAKIFTDIFGLATLSVILHNFIYLKILASLGIITSGFLGIKHNTVKKILAYSTINQLNTIVLILLMVTPSAVKIAITQTIIHSFIKITLFFICGYIYLKNYVITLDDMRGIADKMPYVAIMLVIVSIHLIGLPISSTSFVKKMMIREALLNNDIVVIIGLFVGSVCSFIYMGKLVMFMFMRSEFKVRNLVVDEDNKHSGFSLMLASSLAFMMMLFSPILLKLINELIDRIV